MNGQFYFLKKITLGRTFDEFSSIDSFIVFVKRFLSCHLLGSVSTSVTVFPNNEDFFFFLLMFTQQKIIKSFKMKCMTLVQSGKLKSTIYKLRETECFQHSYIRSNVLYNNRGFILCLNRFYRVQFLTLSR